MALIVETGAALTNSNTYASDADFVAYAAARSVTIPGSAAAREPLLIKAMDALFDLNYVGERRTKEQALDWPRYDVTVEGWPIDYDEIPRQLVFAQCALAIEAITTDLLPTTPANAPGAVTLERVEGAVTVAYANNGTPNRIPAVAKADVLLRSLLRHQGLIGIRV